MLRSKGLFVAILASVLSSAFFLITASGQDNGGGRGGKQKAKQQGPPAPMPDVLKNYQPVTADRLLKPEDGNWLMIRRTYDGWGYSPLDQITPANVARLRPVWGSTTNEGRAHEAAPDDYFLSCFAASTMAFSVGISFRSAGAELLNVRM